MKPKLIAFNEAEYKKKIGSLEFFKKLIEISINTFNSFKIGKFEPADLQDIILQPGYYVTTKLLENKDFSILIEMGLNKAKIIELLSRPENEAELLSNTERLNRNFLTRKETDYSINSVKDLLQHYTFNEEGDLIIKDEYDTSFRKSSETYIQTPEADNIFSFATEIISLFDKHNIKVPLKVDHNTLMNLLFEIVNDKPVININYILDVERRSSSR